MALHTNRLFLTNSIRKLIKYPFVPTGTLQGHHDESDPSRTFLIASPGDYVQMHRPPEQRFQHLRHLSRQFKDLVGLPMLCMTLRALGLDPEVHGKKSLLSMPEEILVLIFRRVERKRDFLALGAVCRKLYRVSRDSGLRKRLWMR